MKNPKNLSWSTTSFTTLWSLILGWFVWREEFALCGFRFLQWRGILGSYLSLYRRKTSSFSSLFHVEKCCTKRGKSGLLWKIRIIFFSIVEFSCCTKVTLICGVFLTWSEACQGPPWPVLFLQQRSWWWELDFPDSTSQLPTQTESSR